MKILSDRRVVVAGPAATVDDTRAQDHIQGFYLKLNFYQLNRRSLTSRSYSRSRSRSRGRRNFRGRGGFNQRPRFSPKRMNQTTRGRWNDNFRDSRDFRGGRADRFNNRDRPSNRGGRFGRFNRSFSRSPERSPDSRNKEHDDRRHKDREGRWAEEDSVGKPDLDEMEEMLKKARKEKLDDMMERNKDLVAKR